MGFIQFFKYQGTGNDFVMIDDREEAFDTDNHELIAFLCHRRFGIGADGLILIRNHPDADFEMIYFNSDGHLTSLCGNGSRCAVMFAHRLGMVQNKCFFMTVEGILKAKIEDGLVHLNMPDVQDIQSFDDHLFINTGSPHHICYVNDAGNYDVFSNGRRIRYGEPYGEEGANVNFVSALEDNKIFVRTYERGVEDETLSCGTGVTAAALAQGFRGAPSPVAVKTPGGELKVSFERDGNGFRNIYLIGPAKMVFEGKISI